MKRRLIKIFLLAFLFRFVLAFVVWHPDVNNHIDWGIRFWEYGPSKFYEANVWSFTWPNQPPGTMYLFAGIRKLFEWIFSIFWFINIKVPLFPSNIMFFLETNLFPALLKLPSIASDLGIAYLIYWIFSKRKETKVGYFGAAIFLFNPVVWYNSAVWGQTDALVNFLGLLSFVLLVKRKLFWAISLYILSLYTKASLLIFAPIFALVILRQKYKLKELVKSTIIPLAILGILTIPFSRGEPYSWLYLLYKDKVFTQQLQLITANAFNFWAGLTGIHEQSHYQLFGPISYQSWGIVFYTLVYLPVLYLVFRKQDLKSIFWALSIVAFSTFMLMTNMHERYLYPFFPVFTLVVTFEKRLLPIYWTVSGIHLVNLYNFWWLPRINPLINFLSAKNRILPRILGFVNFGLFTYLYLQFLRLFKKLWL